jgi:seryl-tRNA synthetase
MPATPDEEIPKHRSKRKTKHVHKWGEWTEIGREVRRSWSSQQRFTVIKWVRVCKKCGQRDKGESALDGQIKTGWYYYRW